MTISLCGFVARWACLCHDNFLSDEIPRRMINTKFFKFFCVSGAGHHVLPCVFLCVLLLHSFRNSACTDESPNQVGADLRCLHAIGEIDDYELLKRNIGEGVSVISGMDAKIRDRLRVCKPASPTQVATWTAFWQPTRYLLAWVLFQQRLDASDELHLSTSNVHCLKKPVLVRTKICLLTSFIPPPLSTVTVIQLLLCDHSYLFESDRKLESERQVVHCLSWRGTEIDGEGWLLSEGWWGWNHIQSAGRRRWFSSGLQQHHAVLIVEPGVQHAAQPVADGGEPEDAAAGRTAPRRALLELTAAAPWPGRSPPRAQGRQRGAGANINFWCLPYIRLSAAVSRNSLMGSCTCGQWF